jgi:hypothetical protein
MLKQQWEEETMQGFIEYLEKENSTVYSISGRDVLVESGQNFDYEITDISGDKSAVEIFRLVENEDGIGRGRAWGKVVERLKEEINKRSLKGFLIDTPDFYYKTNGLMTFVCQQANIIESAIKNEGANKKFEINGYTFNKIKDLDTLIFSKGSEVRSINPVATAIDALARLLPKKNKQLNTSNSSKILLIVNWAIFVSREDIIRALIDISPEDLSNVDLIYYEVRSKEFSLVFNKNVFKAINEKKLVSDGTSKKLLNENLRYMLADKKVLAFEYVKVVTDSCGNLDWLSDRRARENVVIYANHKLEESKNIDDAMWVINNFNDDRSPDKHGENDLGDTSGEYNYHVKMLKGEDVRDITTVRGHLCWLMSGIIVQNKPELYSAILKIIERYLNEDNLYIRAQAIFPLLELVRRIRAVKNQDESLFVWEESERKKVRDLAFIILRNNVKYPGVMEKILHLFGYLRSVDGKEAKEIIDLFLGIKHEHIMRNLAPLIIYFALFRYKDWVDEGVFDSSMFIDILKKQIVDGDEYLKGQIAWHLWNVFTEKHLTYENIREYLLLLADGPYDRHVYPMLGLSMEEITTIAPDDAIYLYKNLIAKIKEGLVGKDKADQYYSLDSKEEMLSLLADKPSDLLEIISNLRILWGKGVYVGDPKIILESYKKVMTKEREAIKDSLKLFYVEIKASFPGLVGINWSD